MTERKMYACDFNPNLHEHAAHFRLSDGEHESLGLRAKDACSKHLGDMVNTAVARLSDGNRVCIARLPNSEAIPLPTPALKVACERCGKPLKAVPGYVKHMRVAHEMEPDLAAVRNMFAKAREAPKAE